MSDLVERLRAAILARKQLAEALDGQTWKATLTDDQRTHALNSGQGKIAESCGCCTTGTLNEAEAEHMAANDPATTIRRCDADLAILDDHAPSTVISYGRELAACRTCFGLTREDVEAFFDSDDIDAESPQHRNLPWPCRTVHLLAVPYGVGEETPGGR